MADGDFDFSLPDSTRPKAYSQGGWKVVAALQLVTLICLALALLSLKTRPSAPTKAGANPEALLELAQRLEKQGLANEAADAWKEYLVALAPEPEKAAKLWYRIGTIQQDGRLYEQALASYYRSDMAMKVPVLETEITRRTQECLTALGKAVAMKRNLEERTTVGGASSASVPLVSIGEWKLSREDIEMQAEQEIDRMLANSPLPEEKKLEQKKQMLKQLNQGDGLMQFAVQLVSQEMLYRAAIEEKLTEQPEVREELLRGERAMLAQAYMRRALGHLEASDADIRDFYKANPDSFTDPAAVRLAHIQFADEESANAAMKSLVGKQDFAELAKLVSKDSATADQGGELKGWFTATAGAEWTREAAKAFLQKEKAAVGEILPTLCKGGNAWHIVKLLELRPERVRDIQDQSVYEQARNMLLERKTGDQNARIMQELARRYQVAWNPSVAKSTASETAQETAPDGGKAAVPALPAGGAQ